MGSEFVVESMRHCFLCLQKILPTDHHNNKGDIESELNTTAASVIHPIQHLSRFLKVDMGTVFHEMDAVPSHLLDEVKQSRLKVELCQECSSLNNKFSGLCRRLEKMEMEVVSFLEVISKKLNDAETTCKVEEIKNKLEHSLPLTARDVWKGKLDVLKVLRTEVVKKCSIKLSSHPPLVKINRMTMKDVTAEKLKMKANSPADDKVVLSSFPKAAGAEEMTAGSSQSRKVKWDDQYPVAEYDYTPDDQEDTGDVYSDQSIMTSEHDTGPPLGTPDANFVNSSKEQQTDAGATCPFITIAPEGPQNADLQEYIVDPKTRKFKCSECSIEFAAKQACQAHYKWFHLNERYKCRFCDKVFKQKATCYSHYKTDHVGVRLRCGICSKDFKSKYGLDYHQSNSSCKMGCPPKPKEYTCYCHICKIGFTFKSNMVTHLRQIHFRTERHKCNVCGREFTRQSSRNAHQKTVHRKTAIKTD